MNIITIFDTIGSRRTAYTQLSFFSGRIMRSVGVHHRCQPTDIIGIPGTLKPRSLIRGAH